MKKEINCYLYLLDTLADWEIAYISAELSSGRYLKKNVKVNFIKISLNLEPITTMGGMLLVPEKTIENVEFKEGDLLILPGANTWQAEKHEKILNLITLLLAQKIIVAAICGATVALAQKGILDSREHTSNDSQFLQMVCPDYKGMSFYLEQPVVCDKNLITASGLAPLEFSVEVFRQLDVMKEDTLNYWWQLYQTKDAKSFYNLMDSLK